MIRILKIKPLISTLESSSHQFLQRCSVSGTANGKSKTKTAAPLKRSKITTKKGSGDGAPKGAEETHVVLCTPQNSPEITQVRDPFS
ncbi:hypothetical protein RchiOBHm_Chr3g0451651 [Rosa chinensis]|uniref:Uncharacterized protein n=1 Tax=Rosa chinensis TaxID=74649 RepID=A0A2P6R657_ROSCH|nr:hypothetical protein RchiOBHm_Chr3g0451651 [Rosa chinensis]